MVLGFEFTVDGVVISGIEQNAKTPDAALAIIIAMVQSLTAAGIHTVKTAVEEGELGHG